MMQLFFVAFTIGIVGSFHCVGMCGPLALALPISKQSFFAKFIGAFLYNAGRIVTYSAFGLVFGLIGKTAGLFGFQQWLSLVVGLLIIIFLVVPAKYKIQALASKHLYAYFSKLRTSLSKLFKQKRQSSLFIIGLLNGLLPCGLVYMAAAGAVSAGSTLDSVVFMAAFGLGTLPVMWSIAFFGNYIKTSIRLKINRAYPYMLALLACLLILRGMGLGIPYLSPQMNTKKAEVQVCCGKPDETQVLK